jgi:hypothetical protein
MTRSLERLGTGKKANRGAFQIDEYRSFASGLVFRCVAGRNACETIMLAPSLRKDT